MWTFHVVKYEPVHEFHIEVLVRGKSVLKEEVIVDNPPESLYLPISLWPAHPGVLVDNRKFLKHDLKTMQMPGFLVMGRELESIVGEEFLDGNAFAYKPLVGSFYEGSEGLGSLVRENLRVGDPGSVVYHSSPVLLFLRILSLDILLLVNINMDELSRHLFLVADNLGFSFEGF